MNRVKWLGLMVWLAAGAGALCLVLATVAHGADPLTSNTATAAHAPGISPSGKYSPPEPTEGTNALPSSTAEAESILQQALKVRQTGSNTFQIGHVEFDKLARTISFPARVAIRADVIEYALVSEQGKTYESLLATEATPVEVHLAALLLGMKQTEVQGEFNTAQAPPATSAVRIEVAWNAQRRETRCALSDLVVLREEGREGAETRFELEKWLYNGSVFRRSGFAAQREGSLVSLIRDPSALINNPGRDRDRDTIHFPNMKRLPREGTAVRVTLRLPPP